MEHIGNNKITSLLAQIHSQFDLDSRKITLDKDSISNFVKAFKLFSGPGVLEDDADKEVEEDASKQVDTPRSDRCSHVSIDEVLTSDTAYCSCIFYHHIFCHYI